MLPCISFVSHVSTPHLFFNTVQTEHILFGRTKNWSYVGTGISVPDFLLCRKYRSFAFVPLHVTAGFRNNFQDHRQLPSWTTLRVTGGCLKAGTSFLLQGYKKDGGFSELQYNVISSKQHTNFTFIFLHKNSKNNFWKSSALTVTQKGLTNLKGHTIFQGLVTLSL